MRLALIAPQFPPDIGGMERYAIEVARELVNRNVDVMVFTTPHSSPELQLPGIRVLPVLSGKLYHDRITIRKYGGSVDVWHVMNAAWAWVALEVGPTVITVHGNDFVSPNPVAGFDLRDRWRLPKGSRLDLSLAKWRTPRVMQRAMPQVRSVIANSRFIERAFLARFPGCAGRTTVSYTGVSAEWFVDKPAVRRSGGPVRFVTACRLSESRKNVDVVLRALAKLKDEYDFSYCVLGDGHLRPQLERKAVELGLGDRVSFLGFVSDEKLRGAIASSDLFILASSLSSTSVEGFGIVYLEANACGVPVLAARLGGAAEAVDEGVSGMFVDQPTVAAIEIALRQFLSGNARFDGNRCREFAMRFPWSKVVDVIARTYASCVASVPHAGVSVAAER